MFAPGGMQNLKQLHLVFEVKEVMHKFGDCNTGLEHLLSLEHVSILIFVDQTTPKEAKAVDEIWKALDVISGKPTLRLNHFPVWVNILAHSLKPAIPHY